MNERATTSSPEDMAGNASIGRLLKDLSHEGTTLIRQEVELAKAEVSEKISQVSNGFIAIAAGAVITFAGLVIMLQAAVVALAEVLPPDLAWLSPLIVGGAVALAGYMALQKGKSNLQADNLALSRTAEELRRDKEFVKEQVK